MKMMRLIGIMVLALSMTSGAMVSAAPIGFSVRSNADDHLYSIDLTTGAATDLGAVGLNDAEGLAFAGSGLYAIGGGVDEFWNITTPPGTKVGNTGSRSGFDAGLDYDSTRNKMFNINGDLTGSYLYQINMATGAATSIGSSPTFADGMAINGSGVAYASDFVVTDSLYRVNLGTGGLTLVGSLGIGNVSAQTGMSFDPLSNVLYALTSTGKIYTLNSVTGGATFVANTLSGFEGFAIIPEPATLSLLAIGGLGLLRRRKPQTAGTGTKVRRRNT